MCKGIWIMVDFSNCLLKYTQAQFGGKFHTVGTQNPKIEILKMALASSNLCL